MKKLLLAVSICAAAVAFAQDNGAAAKAAAPQNAGAAQVAAPQNAGAAQVAAPQNTGAAASQQAAVAQPKETVAETLADLKLGSKALDRFSASVAVGYESEYVFRGIKCADSSITPQVDFGYDLGAGFAAYVGYWGSYEIQTDSAGCQESDLYIGATYTVKNITFDIGLINYIYPDAADENEWKFAVSYDTTDLLGDFNVSPSIAYYYNNELDTNTIELGLFYSAPVMKWINGDNWLTIDSSFIYGYVCRQGSQAKAYSGDYGFVQFKSDVVVSITDYCAWSMGLRCSWASGNGVRGSGAYANPYISADESANVWFGTALSFGF